VLIINLVITLSKATEHCMTKTDGNGRGAFIEARVNLVATVKEILEFEATVVEKQKRFLQSFTSWAVIRCVRLRLTQIVFRIQRSKQIV
jgi:hypothetical protein